jgi:hypothetical protein
MKCYVDRKTSDGSCTPKDMGFDFGGGAYDDIGSIDEEITAGNLAVSEITTSMKVEKETVEKGVFEFTRANWKSECRRGEWPYERVRTKYAFAATVKYSVVQIKWSIEGNNLSGEKGTIQFSAFCQWDSPIPSGHTENRVVTLDFEIDNSQPNESTLRIYNDPADGTFKVNIGMTATVEKTIFKSLKDSFYFGGESVNFEPDHLAAERKCLTKYRSDAAAVAHPTIADIVTRKPGEELARLIRENETALLLVDIMAGAYARDPETFAWAADRLDQETGVKGTVRYMEFMSIAETRRE